MYSHFQVRIPIQGKEPCKIPSIPTTRLPIQNLYSCTTYSSMLTVWENKHCFQLISACPLSSTRKFKKRDFNLSIVKIPRLKNSQVYCPYSMGHLNLKKIKVTTYRIAKIKLSLHLSRKEKMSEICLGDIILMNHTIMRVEVEMYNYIDLRGCQHIISFFHNWNDLFQHLK